MISMTRPDTRWHAPGSAGFIRRDLAGVAALHDPRSGETHLLDLLSLRILDMLADKAQTAAELAENLARELDARAEERAGLAHRVAETLHEFDRIGLIAPRADDPVAPQS